MSIINLADRRKAPPPPFRAGAAYRQVAWLLEAADEARLQGLGQLADGLVDRARDMVAELDGCAA